MKLTEEQRGLYLQLDRPLNEACVDSLRAYHKEMIKHGAPKSFTRYLKLRVRAKWRVEWSRRSIYLGD